MNIIIYIVKRSNRSSLLLVAVCKQELNLRSKKEEEERRYKKLHLWAIKKLAAWGMPFLGADTKSDDIPGPENMISLRAQRGQLWTSIAAQVLPSKICQKSKEGEYCEEAEQQLNVS